MLVEPGALRSSLMKEAKVEGDAALFRPLIFFLEAKNGVSRQPEAMRCESRAVSHPGSG